MYVPLSAVDELTHWLVYFRCKLNQWNCSLCMVGQALDVGVFCVMICTWATQELFEEGGERGR